jgi:hypothetical protein
MGEFSNFNTDLNMSNEDLEHESVLENIKESLKYKDAKSLKMFILERKLSDESIFYEVAGELAISLTAENLENFLHYSNIPAKL